MTRFVGPVTLALSLTLPLFAASSFHFGAVTFTPVDSVAFNVESPESAKPIAIVAVTDFKIDRADLLAAIDPGNSLAQQAGNTPGNVVFIRFPKPGKCGIAAYLGKTSQQIDLGDSFAGKSTVATATRVAGTCATTKPEKMFDDVYDFNLSYDAPITDIPKPTKLAAGGGEPGAAYSALVKALMSQNWDVALAHVEAESVPKKSKTAAEKKEWFHAISLNYPTEVAIGGGQLKGDRALLEFTGVHHDGHKIKGLVAMKKIDGNWRVLDQSMYTTD